MKHLNLIILLLILFSCQNKRKNEIKHLVPGRQENEMIVHYTIDMKDEMLGNGGFILASKNGLIGFEESQSFPAFYYLNNNNEDLLFRFVNKGQGPNEVLYPMNLQYLNEDTLGVFDIMNMSYYHIPIKKNKDSIDLSKRVCFDNRFYHVVKTAYNQYLGLSGESNLFVLLDSKGRSIKSFFEYPHKDKDEKKIDNSIRSLAYQGSIMTNPSATKCIYAPYNGDIIHFYDIKKDNISLVRKLEKAYPDYIADGGNTSIRKTTRRGYVSIATTDSFVYALYCGETLDKLLDNGETMEGKTLRIFDWNGSIKREISLDTPCKHIAVSHDDKIIWAITSNPDIQLSGFNIEKKEEKEKESKTQLIKNEDISELPLVNNIQDKKLTNSEDINNSSTGLVKIDLKNIYKSQTDSFFLVIEEPSLKLVSTRKSSNDINVNAESSENRIVVYFFIKKDIIGEFSDTITLKFNNNDSRYINICGNVY